MSLCDEADDMFSAKSVIVIFNFVRISYWDLKVIKLQLKIYDLMQVHHKWYFGRNVLPFN